MYPTRRVKLSISYDGTTFSGWQKQSHDITIQGEIEHCLWKMTRENVVLHGAGRTDAGVHALGMVAHFDTASSITCNDFQKGLNSMLTGAIRINDVTEVTKEFHSRFSAKKKTYTYIIYTGKIHPPSVRQYSLHIPKALDIELLKQCLLSLIGTHDFSSFENSGSRDKNYPFGRGAVRTIFRAELVEDPKETTLTFVFTGDGFLRNMVRNLVGTLLEAGRGKISFEQFEKITQARNRSAAGPTAPAHGLFLKEVFF